MKRVLNLAPPSIRRRQMMRRLTRAVATAVTCAGAISASWLLIEWSRGAAMAQDLGRLEAEYAPLARLISEQAELVDSIQRLQAREEISLRLTTTHAGVPVLASISQAAADPEAAVYVEGLEYRMPQSTPTRRQATSPRKTPVVSIAGSGRDGLSVARFAERLRASGVYSQVSIESSRPAGGASESLRQFQITCVF